MKGSVGSVVLGVVEKARKKSFEDGEVGANCLQGFYGDGLEDATNSPRQLMSAEDHRYAS